MWIKPKTKVCPACDGIGLVADWDAEERRAIVEECESCEGEGYIEIEDEDAE